MMLMRKARDMRKVSLHDVSGRWPESSLPRLVGYAGVQRFRRCRTKNSIFKLVVGIELKVAWRKVKTNTRFLLLRNVTDMKEADILSSDGS